MNGFIELCGEKLQIKAFYIENIVDFLDELNYKGTGPYIGVSLYRSV